MSGLFRRLAKQANGRATTLHAPARLPFHDAPAATEAFESANSEMSAEAPAPIVAMPAQARPTPPQASATPEALGDTPDDVTPKTSALPPRHKGAQTAPKRDFRGNDTAHDMPEQAANPTRADRLTRRARASASTREASAPVAPPMTAETPSRTLENTNPAPGAAAPLTAARDTEASSIPEFPPTLLPPHTDTARADTATPGARPKTPDGRINRTQTVAADAPNEVHVHIGRIEVTAIQESASKPRAKRNGRAPMSLDEFVAKRQRGSS